MPDPTPISICQPELLAASSASAVPVDLQRGILTTAFGANRFIDMAKALAYSLELYSPNIPRALVTDSQDPELSGLYDILVPYRPEFGKPFIQKLHLDTYSPWQRTMYIDSDCLVTRPIDDFWKLSRDLPFAIFGDARLRIDDCDWFMDTRRVLSHFGVEEIPRFNGGLYIFDSSPTSERIFQTVREMGEQWQELGFHPMQYGGPNDEPMFAVALAMEGLTTVEDGCRTMRTLIRLSGPLQIDVLRGICRFRKGERDISPAIVHFAGGAQNDYRYRREMYRLRLAFSEDHLRKRLASWLPTLMFSHLAVRNRCGSLLRSLARHRRNSNHKALSGTTHG